MPEFVDKARVAQGLWQLSLLTEEELDATLQGAGRSGSYRLPDTTSGRTARSLRPRRLHDMQTKKNEFPF